MFDKERKSKEELTSQDKQILYLLSESVKGIEESIKKSPKKELEFSQIKKLKTYCEKVVDIAYESDYKGSKDFWNPVGYDFITENQINRHMINTGIGILRLDIKNNYSKRDAAVNLMGALLHDIGKYSYENLVVSGKKLTNKEYSDLEQHPMEGYFMSYNALEELINSGLINKDEKEVIEYSMLHHQQRYDGSGYPSVLKGDNIPYSAQRLQVIDATEAMSTFRGYNVPKGVSEIIADLHKNAWIQFSPKAVEELTGDKCSIDLVVDSIEKNEKVKVRQIAPVNVLDQESTNTREVYH